MEVLKMEETNLIVFS
jgi:hypothetical protein